MSRPTKRLKLDNELLLTSNGINKLLNRLDKPSLCSLALTWLAQQQSTDSTPPTEDSSEEEEDSEEQEGNKRVMYEDMRDDTAVSKAKVIKRIQRDWRRGFTYRQVAQLDVQYLLDKPNSRSWTAHQLVHDSSSPHYTTPAQLLTRLRSVLSPYYNHHLHLHTTAQLTILRLQLLPTSPTSALPSALTLLHLPSTPFLLLPTLTTSLGPILLQCLSSSVCSPPASDCRPLDLKGKDWRGLREMLLGRMAAGGGGMGRWRAGKGEGGGPLVPEGRRVERDDSKPSPAPSAGATPQDFTPTPSTADPKLQALREQEIGDVFGREDLPILERIDYEISLPYPSPSPPSPSTLTSTTYRASHPPFLLRFEGTHVLNGLRAAVGAGFVDGAEEGMKEGGLPRWIGEVAGEGRNLLRVGEGGRE